MALAGSHALAGMTRVSDKNLPWSRNASGMKLHKRFRLETLEHCWLPLGYLSASLFVA
jgi:hypothetical protein